MNTINIMLQFSKKKFFSNVIYTLFYIKKILVRPTKCTYCMVSLHDRDT